MKKKKQYIMKIISPLRIKQKTITVIDFRYNIFLLYQRLHDAYNSKCIKFLDKPRLALGFAMQSIII